MLDLRYVTENLDVVRAGLARRGFDDSSVLDRLAKLAEERRAQIGAVDELRRVLNDANQAMASIKDKKSEEFGAKRDELRAVSADIKTREAALSATEAELGVILTELPNLPDDSAPEGLTEAQNVELRTWGAKPELAFEAKDHVDLGEALGILDFEGGAKISGARFVVLRGMGARLERALMQFMLDLHVDEHGYEELWVPVLLKDTALFGTGQLPKFGKDAFRIAKDDDWAKENEATSDLYLCPTAEVPVTNLLAGELIDGASLPRAYTAYSACFRSEAGSYGRDTRGLIRQHQFDKVELVRFTTPETALEEHAKLTAHAEAVLQKLGLHYRVVELCAGDMGFGAKKCFDIEVWLPGQNAFREISSCSLFGDFQARRMNARYRPETTDGKKAKPVFLHTINGSGLALGRTLVAILEQGQQADGSVVIPEALRPYVGGRSVLTASE